MRGKNDWNTSTLPSSRISDVTLRPVRFLSFRFGLLATIIAFILLSSCQRIPGNVEGSSTKAVIDPFLLITLHCLQTISSPLQAYASPVDQGRVSTPSDGEGDGGGDSDMEVELSEAGGSGSGRQSVTNEWKHDDYASPIGIRREFRTY